MVAVIRVTKVPGVQDVNIALLDDLDRVKGTLLEGSLKKRSQFSAWSNISGMKTRFGLSGVVDEMWTPLSLTSLEPTS